MHYSTFFICLLLGRPVNSFQMTVNSAGIDRRAMKHLTDAKRPVSLHSFASLPSTILQAQASDNDENGVDDFPEKYRVDLEEDIQQVTYERHFSSHSSSNNQRLRQHEISHLDCVKDSSTDIAPIVMSGAEEGETYESCPRDDDASISLSSSARRISSKDRNVLRFKQSTMAGNFPFDVMTWNLPIDEIYDMVVRKSRPKKRLISLHSFLSSMSAMVSIVILLPTFAPGFDEFGLPQIFDYNQHAVADDLLWQCQFCAFLQMISSAMGLFRIPKNSPSIRTNGFQVMTAAIVLLDLLVLSSLNGTNVYLFDAFSAMGRVILVAMYIVLLRTSLDSISLIIGDKDRNGWDKVPGFESRLSATLTMTPFFLLVSVLGNAVLPVLGDETLFQTYAAPFFSVFSGETLGYIAITQAIGLGALLGTLQFEKKISNFLGSFGNTFIGIFLAFDWVKFMYVLNMFPENIPHSEYFTVYLAQLQSTFHTRETLITITAIAVIKGLQDLNMNIGRVGTAGSVSDQNSEK